MLTKRQQEIVNGSLLGDGCIWTDFKGSPMKWQFSQSKLDHRGTSKASYMCWFVKETIDVGCSLRPRTLIRSDKTFESYVYCSRCSRFWNQLEAKWYVPRNDHVRFKRRKVIPTDLVLTPLTLCVWYMDDGSNNPRDANLELNTQGFTEAEVEFLISRLELDLGVKAKKKAGGRKSDQYKIFVGRESYFEFHKLVKPFVAWDCFAYKIDTSGYNKVGHRGQNHSMAKISEADVRRAFQLRQTGKLQKEIAAELGISKAAVSLLLSGQRWSHLGLGIKTIAKPRLTNKTKGIILQMSDEGLNQKQIAEELGINQSSVSRVLRKSAQKIADFSEPAAYVNARGYLWSITSRQPKLRKS